MESETFKMRKQFLEEFYNIDRIKFLRGCEIEITNDERNTYFERFDGGNSFKFETNVLFVNPYNRINFNISFKNFYKLLKPFVYFLYSITHHEKFLKDYILTFERIEIKCLPTERDEYFFNAIITPPFRILHSEKMDFLKYIKTRSHLNESDISLNHIIINMITGYHYINRTQFIRFGGTITLNGEDKIINSSQTFKFYECVICLTNQPIILFCNCGHIPICTECYKLKSLSVCPVCKTENTILRVIE